MARAGGFASRSVNNVAEDLICAICRGYFVDPRILECNHAFCFTCLKGLVQNTQSVGIIVCPVCRQPASANEACNNRAIDIANKMEGSRQQCQTCNRWIPLANYVQHVAECEAFARNSKMSTTTGLTVVKTPFDAAHFGGSSAQGLAMPSSDVHSDAQQRATETASRDAQYFDVSSNVAAGRRTFACPYCQQQNLVQEELVLHCLSLHKQHGNHRLVCPICASMPWGNSQQKSLHLIDHLQLRHKYDYSVINGDELNEEDAFEQAVKKSVNEYYDSFKKGQ